MSLWFTVQTPHAIKSWVIIDVELAQYQMSHKSKESPQRTYQRFEATSSLALMISFLRLRNDCHFSIDTNTHLQWQFFFLMETIIGAFWVVSVWASLKIVHSHSLFVLELLTSNSQNDSRKYKYILTMTLFMHYATYICTLGSLLNVQYVK